MADGGRRRRPRAAGYIVAAFLVAGASGVPGVTTGSPQDTTPQDTIARDSMWLPPRTSPSTDLALNPVRRGYPHPLASDSGWGGGRDKWDIIDGHRWYPGVWHNGLAFTGGLRAWAELCGWRQATIDFGRPVSFDSVVVWHNGWNHVPRRYRVQYWDGKRWREAFSTEDGLSTRRDSTMGNRLWDRITDASFPVVTATKLRYVLENCERPSGHGWIMELEVYGPSTQPGRDRGTSGSTPPESGPRPTP